jgi:hypothetical protein
MNDEARPWTDRVIYIVPANTQPWAEAKQRATECLEDLQWYFADEMRRLGYGPMTFELTRDEEGSLVFYQINSNLGRDDFRKNFWNNCKNTASAYGLRDLNYVTVYFFEAYSIVNGTVEDAGSRGQQKGRGGEAFISSLHLKMARREWLTNNNGYGGEVFDWIDSQPMKANTLSWNGRGFALGDVSGSGFGIVAHEFAHCFGPPPQVKGKRGPQGLLMGNGCRGMRGYFRPDLTEDRCFIREEDAAVFSRNDFFAERRLRPKSAAFPDQP